MLLYNQVKREQTKQTSEGEQSNDAEIYKNKTCGVKYLQRV